MHIELIQTNNHPSGAGQMGTSLIRRPYREMTSVQFGPLRSCLSA